MALSGHQDEDVQGLGPGDSRRELRRLLKDGASGLQIQLNDTILDRLILLTELLVEGNLRLNLTAIRAPRDIILRHLVDSLTGLAAIDDFNRRCLPVNGTEPVRVVDVGTGGGFPGVPIAITRPQWRVTMIDSVGKKVRFVEDVIDKLGLDNAEARSTRAEELGRTNCRDAYDIAVARAVAPTPMLIEYCAPLVKPGGLVVLYKSGDAEAEVSSAQRALQELGCSLTGVHRVPPEVGLGRDRFLLVLEKGMPTPERFPRRLGAARKSPLV